MRSGTNGKASSIDLIEVQDRQNDAEISGGSFCYTKMLLKGNLQLMGCKTRVAHKVCDHYLSSRQQLQDKSKRQPVLKLSAKNLSLQRRQTCKSLPTANAGS